MERLAVLPVRRLPRRASGVWWLTFGHERLVEDERRSLERGVHVAEAPLGPALPASADGRQRRRRGSASVHLISTTVIGEKGGGIGLPAPLRIHTLPSVRAFGPPGLQAVNGSTTKGSASNSTTIFSGLGSP